MKNTTLARLPQMTRMKIEPQEDMGNIHTNTLHFLINIGDNN